MAVTSTTLGKACTLKAGKFVAANDIADEYRDGLFPCYGGNGIRGYVTEYSHEGEYPLIGRQGALCGNVNFASGKFRATEHAVVVQPNVQMNIRWLYYKLLSMDLGQYATGAAQPGLAVAKLEQLPFVMPSLEEQERLSTLCDQVEVLISLRKQQIAKLDELVKARFVEMFGMPGSDPFGWGLNHLGDCCQINPKKSQDKRLRSGLTVSFVPMPAVSETGDMDPTTEKDYDEVKTGFTYFAEGDVLFAKITPCMENGKGAVARNLKNGIGFGSTEFHVLRPLAGKSDSDWLYAVTAFSEFRKDAESNMTGSAGQRRVPASFLEQYRVAIPPVNMQRQFAVFVAQTDQQKLTIQQSLVQLELLKKALMQKYFG